MSPSELRSAIVLCSMRVVALQQQHASDSHVTLCGNISPDLRAQADPMSHLHSEGVLILHVCDEKQP